MTEAGAVNIRPEHLAIVCGLLRAHLPSGAKVWVFGSRATGRARPYSDLDLLIDAGRRLSLDEHAILAEAFSDSDLPYKVDVVDRHAITDGFRDRIKEQLVQLGTAGCGDA